MEPYNFKSRYTIDYILHYSKLYRQPEICTESYKQPFIHLANSRWTADKIHDDVGTNPIIIQGGINPNHFRYDPSIKKEYEILCYGSERGWKRTRDIEKGARSVGLNLKKYEGAGISQDEMYIEYNKAKMFISASLYEGWNNPGLEALACGTPLIRSKDGGSNEYCIDNYNCLSFEPRNVDEMKRRILQVNQNKGLRQMLSLNGRRTARKFTWEKVGGKMDRVLNKIVERDGQPTIEDITQFNNEKWNVLNDNGHKVSVIANINEKMKAENVVNFLTCLRNQRFKNFKVILLVTGNYDKTLKYLRHIQTGIKVILADNLNINLNEYMDDCDSFVSMSINDNPNNYFLLDLVNDLEIEMDYSFDIVGGQKRYLVRRDHLDVFDANPEVIGERLGNFKKLFDVR